MKVLFIKEDGKNAIKEFKQVPSVGEWVQVFDDNFIYKVIGVLWNPTEFKDNNIDAVLTCSFYTIQSILLSNQQG